MMMREYLKAKKKNINPVFGFHPDEISLYNSIVEIFHTSYLPKLTELQDINTKWFFPEKYNNLNIKEFLLDLCKTSEEKTRVILEFREYESRNLVDMLKSLKYIVDVAISNNIVLGLGRGSSTSSYILYLLGIHHINSIKYNLDYKEFLK